MANFGFFQVLSIKKAWKKYLTVLNMYLQERKRSKMFHVSFFFYWDAFVNAVNLYSLGRAKGEMKKGSLKKNVFSFPPVLVGVTGTVPVSDKRIDRNYESRISVNVLKHDGIINERKVVESKSGAKFRLHFVREN